MSSRASNLPCIDDSAEPFGVLEDGRPTQLFTLRNDRGLQVSVTDFGAALVSIRVPDRRGEPGEVLLGYGSAAEYAVGRRYFGAAIGRCCNRIRGARFMLDGQLYTLTANEGANHLHGGQRGLHAVLWEMLEVGARELRLRHLSEAGAEGYPGRLLVNLRYRLDDANALHVDLDASCDRPTLCNLTLHPWFNLANGGRGPVLDHELRINASRFTPVDAQLIPTGELRDVAGTPFDFRAPRRIGERIDAPHEQLRHAKGYDHNFVLDRSGEVLELQPESRRTPAVAAAVGATAPLALPLAAEVHASASGRVLRIGTTEPGLQFYSGQVLDRSDVGHDSTAYGPHAGFCLEPQHFPDAPNQPAFPSVVLRPGQRYLSRTVYAFSVR